MDQLNPDDWISVSERYPEHLQKIFIRIKDVQDNSYEIPAIFKDHEDYRSWVIEKSDYPPSFAQPDKPIPRPTHWKTR